MNRRTLAAVIACFVVVIFVPFLPFGADLLRYRCSERGAADYGLMEWRLDAEREVFDRRRSALALQMQTSQDLVGDSRADVLLALGKPDKKTEEGVVIYSLGRDPSFGIDFWELRVEFDENGFVRATAIDIY